MINLKEACQIILSKHPGKGIHVVNEWENVFEFILLNKEEIGSKPSGILPISTVNKKTGEVTDNLWGYEDVFQGDYKHYTHSDLERL